MRLLIVEDSRRLRQALELGMKKSHYSVDMVEDGEQALHMARRSNYDVIVLDLMIPKIDGLTVLKTLREEGNPSQILILTAKDSIEAKVRGLQKGADDYLVKPFAFDELLARVQALVRRRHNNKQTKVILAHLEIDITGRQVRINGARADLTAREFALLEYLAVRQGHVVTRREIEEKIYDGKTELASNSVDSAVCLLRRKIDLPGKQSLIATRRGLGYCLTAPEPE
jgi:DNA-binding response OmpR family regulator